MNIFGSFLSQSGGQPGLKFWLSSLFLGSSRTQGHLNFATLPLLMIMVIIYLEFEYRCVVLPFDCKAECKWGGREGAQQNKVGKYLRGNLEMI